ncbi:hypothetical protein SUGI_0443550 [Cryptomeria japonica]|uniref:zinc protease PQQL-like n=1 Tax=Cryptomeria japonica TaxID=3369 RepID=UPI002408DC8F|nr:zinc protease PQQL-like [Cryptomeria japonica]GLJ23434.1 hypothetical protein SUGI_0443550 [Cryptomeria japonica]
MQVGIVSKIDCAEFGVTELILNNGMRICYKCTDFPEDQVLFSGFAYGGLSELSKSDYLSCSIGSVLAGEIGVFGYKPAFLMEMLDGKKAEVGTEVLAYMRTFSGDCSSSDLETALELVNRLFLKSIIPGDDEINVAMQTIKEKIRAQEREPFTAFSERINQINYGKSYFFKPIRIKDIQKMNPKRSCQYFDSCFKDPSTFTVVIVGNIKAELVLPLILQYLGDIPKPLKPVMHFNREELKALPFMFSKKRVREVVHSQKLEAQCSVQITFPIELKAPNVMEDIQFVGFIRNLLETRIIRILHINHPEIYSVSVSAFLGFAKPSRTDDLHGDIAIKLSCAPDSSPKLVDLSLDEILHLQKEGPSDEDVSTMLESEESIHQKALQENEYWLEHIMRGYLSRSYAGDLNASLKAQDECRSTVRSSLTRMKMQEKLQRILPSPCTKQYTVVVLMPKISVIQRLKSFLFDAINRSSMAEKVMMAISTAVVLVPAVVWFQFSRKTRNIA